MQTSLFAALCVAAMTPTLAGQVVYSPANFATAEANTVGWGGLGIALSPSVLLSIHDELQGTPRTIRAVSVRRDGITNPQSYPAASWLVSVFASTAVTTAATPSATLAANHGADKKTVAQFVLVQLPASTFSGPEAPFEFRIPFTTPFQFGGAGPLCLEIQVHSRSHTGTYYLDYATGQSTNPAPAFVTWGVGCNATGIGSPMSLAPNSTANWPGAAASLGYHGTSMPASGLVTLLLGGSRTTFGGLQLPFELPTTASGTSGPCSIYNDVLITIPALTTATGTLTLHVGFTATPVLNGVSLFGQVLTLDAAANPWGMVTSNGVQHEILAPYGAIPIGTVNSDNTIGPTGVPLPNQGYVMKFET